METAISTSTPSRDPVLFRSQKVEPHPRIRKALVLEDDDNLFPIFWAALREAIPGIEMDWVNSAEQGLKKSQSEDYEIIIADVFLGGNKTGITFWENLKSVNTETPVIITSGMNVETFLRLLGKEAEAPPAYVKKPIQIDGLKSIIQGLVMPGPCS